MYPYRGEAETNGICQSTGHQRLPSDSSLTSTFNVSETALKQMLLNSPVAVLLYADTNFWWYQSGVYSCQDSETQPSQLNHALLVVGYDE
jgi:hypothetical protein